MIKLFQNVLTGPRRIGNILAYSPFAQRRDQYNNFYSSDILRNLGSRNPTDNQKIGNTDINNRVIGELFNQIIKHNQKPEDNLTMNNKNVNFISNFREELEKEGIYNELKKLHLVEELRLIDYLQEVSKNLCENLNLEANKGFAYRTFISLIQLEDPAFYLRDSPLLESISADISQNFGPEIGVKLAHHPKWFQMFNLVKIYSNYNEIIDLRLHQEILGNILRRSPIYRSRLGEIMRQRIVLKAPKAQEILPKVVNSDSNRAEIPFGFILQEKFKHMSNLDKIFYLKEMRTKYKRLGELKDLRAFLLECTNNGSSREVISKEMVEELHKRVGENNNLRELGVEAGEKLIGTLCREYVVGSQRHIGSNNLHDLFNYAFSAQPDLLMRREELIRKGVGSHYVDRLARLYLTSTIIDGTVSSLGDIYDIYTHPLHARTRTHTPLQLDNIEYIPISPTHYDNAINGLSLLPQIYAQHKLSHNNQEFQGEGDLSYSEDIQGQRENKSSRPIGNKGREGQRNMSTKMRPDKSELFRKLKESFTRHKKYDEKKQEYLQSNSSTSHLFEDHIYETDNLDHNINQDIEIVNKKPTRYDNTLFKKFHAETEEKSRLLLEEFILNLASTTPQELPIFVDNMIQEAYDLQNIFGNIEYTFYQIFATPIIGKHKDINHISNNEGLLAGNIFNYSIGSKGYLSILKTLRVKTKKKHLKKLMSHMNKYAHKPEAEELKLIINIGKEQKYPILTSEIFLQFILRDIKIDKEAFCEFISYLSNFDEFDENIFKFFELLKEKTNLILDFSIAHSIIQKKQDNKASFTDLHNYINKIINSLPNQTQIESKVKKFNIPNTEINIAKQFYADIINKTMNEHSFTLAERLQSEKDSKFDYEGEDDYIQSIRVSYYNTNFTRLQEIFFELINKEVIQNNYFPTQKLESQERCEQIVIMICEYLGRQFKKEKGEILMTLINYMHKKRIIVNNNVFYKTSRFYATEINNFTYLCDLLRNTTLQNTLFTFSLLDSTKRYFSSYILYTIRQFICYDATLRQDITTEINNLKNLLLESNIDMKKVHMYIHHDYNNEENITTQIYEIACIRMNYILYKIY